MEETNRPGIEAAGRAVEHMRFRDLVELLIKEEDEASAELILMFPTLSVPLVESRWKQVDSKYKMRLDKRPLDQGGDQLHIQSRDGSKWAYRHTGDRSEPHKYKLSATRAVQDIVRSTFNLPPDRVIELKVVAANRQRCLVEVDWRD